MPRSQTSADAIRNQYLRGAESTTRINRLKIQEVLMDSPDAVGPVYDVLAGMGLVPYNCMEEMDKEHGGKSVVLEQSETAQKREDWKAREKEKRAAALLTKIPTRYVTLAGMSVGLLADRIVKISKTMTCAEELLRHFTARGSPQENKTELAKVVTALTGIPRRLSFDRGVPLFRKLRCAFAGRALEARRPLRAFVAAHHVASAWTLGACDDCIWHHAQGERVQFRVRHCDVVFGGRSAYGLLR